MDIETFKRLIDRTKLGADACKMAKSILVEGLGVPDAARLAGRKPHEAEKAVTHVLRRFMDEGRYPRDWVVVTVALPPFLADLVRITAENAAFDSVRSPYNDEPIESEPNES